MTRPLVIAHRGASAELPENTLPAFERAIEIGADYVEFDVRARSDGELVVSHDRPRRREEPPALAEVLDLCRGRIGVMVELKTPHRYRRHRIVERTLELLDEDAVVVCFEPGATARVRALRPELRTVQHVAFVPLRRAASQGCWAVGLEDRRATPRAIRAAQQARARDDRLHRQRARTDPGAGGGGGDRDLHGCSPGGAGVPCRAGRVSRRDPSVGTWATTREPTGSASALAVDMSAIRFPRALRRSAG